MSEAKNKGLTSDALKIIAIIAMTIDHATWLAFPGYQTNPAVLVMHLIGRLTAPIMMYFVAEGFYHTRNIRKYITRMAIFAVISHFAYNYFHRQSMIPFKDGFFDQTSVIWGLLMGLIALTAYKSQRLKAWVKVGVVCLCLLLAFPANWSMPTVFAVLLMGMFHGNFKKQMVMLTLSMLAYSIVYVFAIDLVYGILQMGTVLAIPVLACYNGRRGKPKHTKWLFYVYYPLHLFVLGAIAHGV